MKDPFDVAGLATTWGLPQFKSNYAARDARVVDRLTQAGAIIIGKTNIPAYGGAGDTDNELFGRTLNPWNVECIVGGSCGGGAAAVAAGLTPLDVGSDSSGSLRFPAHYCGVYSHRPTFGIVDLEGNSHPGGGAVTDVTAAGPIARSAADLAAALRVLAGPSRDDARGWALQLPEPAAREMRDYRIVLITSHPTAEVDATVVRELEALGRFMESRGARVKRDVLPALDPAAAYRVFAALAQSSIASIFSDNIFAELIGLAESGEGYGALDNAYVGNLVMRHRDWIEFDQQRMLLRQSWSEFFVDCDLLLCPAATTTAPRSDDKGFSRSRTLRVNGRAVSDVEQTFWASLASAAGLPATTAPIACSKEGLPIAVQIIGPRYGDFETIRFAEILGVEYRSFVPPQGWS